MLKKKYLSISTKTGDKGETGLANGERLPKTDAVFEVLGTLDELNSWLGLVVAELPRQFETERQFLLFIQDSLFHMGAELAQTPNHQVSDDVLKKIEAVTESMQQQMVENWVMKFLLPGGAPLVAQVDVARTVCRRFERVLLAYQQIHPVRDLVVKSINRLSDYLFVLRTWLNLKLGYKEMIFDSKNSHTKKM